jgi:AraC-like DNA-binding protein
MPFSTTRASRMPTWEESRGRENEDRRRRQRPQMRLPRRRTGFFTFLRSACPHFPLESAHTHWRMSMPGPDGRNAPVFRGRMNGKGRVTSRHKRNVLGVLVRAVLEKRSVDLDVETGIQLVVAGLGAAASHCGLSSRTVRRRFEKAGWSASAFVKDARSLCANALLSQGWRTERVARTLGYSGSSAFRRFLRLACGSRVRDLRGSCETRSDHWRIVDQSRIGFSGNGPRCNENQTAPT